MPPWWAIRTDLLCGRTQWLYRRATLGAHSDNKLGWLFFAHCSHSIKQRDNFTQPSLILSNWLTLLVLLCSGPLKNVYLQFLPNVTYQKYCIPDPGGNKPGRTASNRKWKEAQYVPRDKQFKGHRRLGQFTAKEHHCNIFRNHAFYCLITVHYHWLFPVTQFGCQQNLNTKCSTSMNYSQITGLNKCHAVVCLLLKLPLVAQESCKNSSEKS